MPERRDYLSVCNDHGVPLDDFQAQFCVRCVQPECTRSRAGGLFESRVGTWEDRLFHNPPRMPKDDPLYAVLSAKRFLDIDMGRIPEVHGRSDWVDPRALETPAEPVEKPRPARQPRPRPAPEVGATADAAPPVPPQPRGPLNTPFVQGAFLDSAPSSEPKPADRWSAPPPAAPAEPGVLVVKAGARIKFTSGDGVRADVPSKESQ